MILHDFVALDLPAPQVRRALLESDALLGESATAAYAQGERLLLRVGPHGSDACFAKAVAVQVGAPVNQGEVVTLPVLWEAVDSPGLFPRMDGSLEVVPVSPTRTQVTFYGRYDPPLGRLGQGLDRILLHHVAEHTVRAFLSEIARRVASRASA